MSDFLRIALIIIGLYLSFRLGVEYAWRKALSDIIQKFGQGMEELSRVIKKPDKPA